MSELAAEPNRGAKFVSSAVWSSVGVMVSLVTGLLLSPYLIRKLGPDGYGVWTLTFNMVEYYWLLDLGFRSATVKFVAHHWTLRDSNKTSEVISTALVYSSAAAAFILIGLTLTAPWIQTQFKIPPAYQNIFLRLLFITTFSWCVSIVFGVFGAAIEAVQRFDLSTHANIVGTLLRAIGTFLLLYKGYGLVEIGILVAVSQIVTFGLQYRSFLQVFIGLRLAPRNASFATVKQMMRFGIHTFLGNVSQQALDKSAPVLIGHFYPVSFLGFYSLPQRLLQYTSDMIMRIGIVTNTNAAELAARDDRRGLAALAIFPNRYSLALFIPLAIVLTTHGSALFHLWVGDEFARHSAPLLPVLLLSSMLASVGQFSSTMLLQGMGKYQNYARAIMVEAILGITTLWFVLPRYGILGAAWVSCLYMLANRCLFVSWLTSREVGLSHASFLNSIYSVPLLSAVPVAALAWWLRITILPGTSWFQLIIVGAVISGVYYGLALCFVLSDIHRRLLLNWIEKIPLMAFWSAKKAG